jgi:hypothetical protein
MNAKLHFVVHQARAAGSICDFFFQVKTWGNRPRLEDPSQKSICPNQEHNSKHGRGHRDESLIHLRGDRRSLSAADIRSLALALAKPKLYRRMLFKMRKVCSLERPEKESAFEKAPTYEVSQPAYHYKRAPNLVKLLYWYTHSHHLGANPLFILLFRTLKPKAKNE